MSMSGDNIDKLYYSQNNLDNTYKQVADEVNRRTNKDIANNTSFKKTFQSMAKMVYDKCPPNDRNLMNVNTRLIDKSITYFHGKIFEKNVSINNPTEKQSTQAQRESIINNINNISKNGGGIGNGSGNGSTSNEHGFTMIKENEDLKGKYESLMAQRDSLSKSQIQQPQSLNSPNMYMPQTAIKADHFVTNEQFKKLANNDVSRNESYDNQYLRIADETPQNKSTLQKDLKLNDFDFNVNSFNLSDDMSSSLFNGENIDSPLYQNIENLQKMEGSNPMSMLEDYQKQRTQQSQEYANIEKRENITALRTQSIRDRDRDGQGSQGSQGVQYPNDVYNNAKNYTNAQTRISETIVEPLELYKFGNELTNKFMDKIEKRIVNDNNAQPQSMNPDDLSAMQTQLIQSQRDSQPKFIEKVHYININSVDRLWEQNAESRFQFKVQFNQNSTFEGAGISQLYKNILSVELVSAILPMDTTINAFDTRLYGGLMKFPYLLLRIDELDSVFRGTNNWADRAFSTLLFDKCYFTNTLSNDYISNATSSIVNSVPKVGFTPEYNRGFLKFNPAYFEKKKFYNNPLASLNRMSITITDPRGNFINDQSDVLSLSNVAFTTNTMSTIADTELIPSLAFPYATQNNYRMIEITSSTYFSNRLFRVGDRILFRDFASNVNISLATNNPLFNSFINREEGHIIINLQGEDNTANGGNKSFINKLYISPPGTFNSTGGTVSGYYENNLDFTGAIYGTLINMDLQSHLLFRIVTRDADTSGTLKPINVY